MKKYILSALLAVPLFGFAFFQETFDGETKATLTAQGWEYFPTSGFSISAANGYSGDYMRANAGIGNPEYMATPCVRVYGAFDTLEMWYRFFGGASGTLSVGYQNGTDPVGTNVVWIDTVTINNSWQLASIPYLPPPWPYLCRIIYGFNTLDASAKIGIDNFTSKQGVGGTCTALLPVELTEFNAEASTLGSTTTVNLFWRTETESNMSHYEIMRSTDGIRYESLGTVHSSGFSTTPLTYDFADQIPLPGYLYYYLKMVETTGHVDHSPIEKIYLDINGSIIISQQVMYYNFDVPSLIQIYSPYGKKVYSLETTEAGNFSLQDLEDGLYVLILSGKLRKSWMVYLNNESNAYTVLQ